MEAETCLCGNHWTDTMKITQLPTVILFRNDILTVVKICTEFIMTILIQLIIL